MRRPTKRNVAALKAAIEAAEVTGLPYASDLADLLARIQDDTSSPVATGPSAGVLEKTLLDSGKMVAAGPDTDKGWWAAQGYRAKRVGATVEDAVIIASWMKRQHWMSGGVSLDVVLKHWANWLVRAKAEQDTRVATANSLEDLG